MHLSQLNLVRLHRSDCDLHAVDRDKARPRVNTALSVDKKIAQNPTEIGLRVSNAGELLAASQACKHLLHHIVRVFGPAESRAKIPRKAWRLVPVDFLEPPSGVRGASAVVILIGWVGHRFTPAFENAARRSKWNE